MKYVRLVAGKNGKTHFEDATLKLDEADYRPPAPMLYVSHVFQTDGVQFVRFSSGWAADAIHPPKKQFFIPVKGHFEIAGSGGDKRSFGPGDCLLMEDVEGDGHHTRAKGAESIALVIPVD